MKIEVCITAYVNSRRAGNRREITVRLYQDRLDRFRAYLHSVTIDDFDTVTPEHVRNYLAFRLDSGRAASTVSQDRIVILTMLGWCEREGYIDRQDWARRVEPLRQDSKEPRCLTEMECNRLFDAIEHHNYRDTIAEKRDPAMVRLLIDTGLREAELLNITMADLDLTARAIHVAAASKSRRERTVWFGAETLRALRAYLRVRGTIQHNHQCTSDAITQAIPYVWLSRHRRPLSKQQLYVIIKQAADWAALTGVTVHTLRHTAATLLLRNGMPLVHVQRVLGHKSLSMTLRYTHLVNDDLRRAYIINCPVDKLVV